MDADQVWALRRMMQNKIYEVLIKLQPNPSDEWRQQLPTFVKCFEEQIFKESHIKGNYISILQHGVETRICDILNNLKQRQEQQRLRQEQQQIQQQNHYHSVTYRNIESNSSKTYMMIPTPGMSHDLPKRGQSSLATESFNRGIAPTDASAGPHQPDSLLYQQQHQSQGRPAQEMHLIPNISQQVEMRPIPNVSQQVTVNNNNSNNNFPFKEGVPGPSTTGTNKGSLSQSQKESEYLILIKLIMLMHHARSCPAPVGHCPEKNCVSAQKLVKHTEECYQKQCHRHCMMARKSLLHFQDCKALNCPVCGPVHKLLFISEQKAMSLRKDLKGVTGKVVHDKTETELALPSFPKPSAMHAPDSLQPCMLSLKRGLNQSDSSGLLNHHRDVSPGLIDLTKPQHQPHPTPQQPLMKRQRVHMDAFPVPTKQKAECAHSRLEMDAKFSRADSSHLDVKSSHTGATPLRLPGIFSEQTDHKTNSVDLSVGQHRPHLSPQMPPLKRPRINMDASAVPKKTTNRSFSSVQEVCPTERIANAKMEMAVPIGAVESSQPVVKSSQNGVNLSHSSGVFSDRSDGTSLLMDLSKGQHQPQLQPKKPVPKRPRINMDTAAVQNNTTNTSFHTVKELLPSGKSADGVNANLEIDGHIGAVDSSQHGLKSSEKGTQLDSSGEFSDQRHKEPNLVAVSQALQLSHPLRQESQPKRPIMNVDSYPEPLNAVSTSSSAKEDTLPEEHCVNNADARVGMCVKINPVSQNLEIAPGVCDPLAVQMGYSDKCNVSAPTSAQADVNPTSLSEDEHRINQKVCAAVENKERGDENALKSTQERDKNLTAVKSENSKLKGVSMMEFFTPERVKEHIFSLSQNKGEAEENSCGLCNGNELLLEPRPIYCTPCGARIKRNVTYYMVDAGEQRHATCAPCYNAEKETIHIEGHMVPKARFEKKLNKENHAEAWVQCDKCEKWQHQICALFNKHINNSSQAEYTCPSCYISEVERGERAPLPESASSAAKDLPRTRLSDFIEDRLFRRLEIERQERASSLQKRSEDVPGAEGLVLRVVSAADKRSEVKPRFYEIFQEKYPAEFPYKSKTILLFQNIDGVDVCIFAMYVQECGADCALPNQRHVYISYLDSVKYFKPDIKTINGEALRTFVYHEILIGYLEYCKKRGFVSCYIWACPPRKGDDYILYCHPKIQKTPKEDKLREWYLSMLKKGMRENIVVGLTNLHDHFFTQSGESKAKVTAARLPYFDGDYWPGAAEDIINEMHQEEEGKQQKGKTKKNIVSKRAVKTSSHTDISDNASKDSMLMKKLGEGMKKMKDNFIIAHLQHSCNNCGRPLVSGMRWVCNSCQCFYLCDSCHDAEKLLDDRERHPTNSRDKHTFHPVKSTGVPNDTKDPDGIHENPLFTTREAFLSLCQANRYQFDTLRRAKHSSVMVLYHLHNPTAPAFLARCSNCTVDIDSGQGWRCNVCPDFELCNSCYEQEDRVQHPHQLTNHPSSANKDEEHQTARRQKGVTQVMELSNMLAHACKCQAQQCQVQGCRTLKSLFHHGTHCPQGASGGCPRCKKMWKLLSDHARGCKESKCNVPRCKDLREQHRRFQQQTESRQSQAAAK